MSGLQRLSHLSSLRAASISGIPTRSWRSMPIVTSSALIRERKSSYLHTFSEHSPCIKRPLSSITKGQDLLEDSLAYGPHRKIILDSYGPSGFDVKGLVRVGDDPVNDETTGDDVIVHINGSIVVFPHACFLWNVKAPKDITLESLSVVKLYKPTVEYLFIGCDSPMSPVELNRIKKDLGRSENHVIVEQMDVMNAMGTFNILNGEDRRVACVLVLHDDKEEK